MQPEIQTADGDGEDEVSLLATFIYHLSRVADARGAGVGGVMRGLITEALHDFQKEYENAEG